MIETAYEASPIRPQRFRRTNADLAVIDDVIVDVAAAEHPITVRGIYYRVVSRGLRQNGDGQLLVPKDDSGYNLIQRRCLLLRRSGALPYDHIADGTRYRLAPQVYSGVGDVLRGAAYGYRRDIWEDQGYRAEVWVEKDAMKGVLAPVTQRLGVPLLCSRGYASETFVYESAAELVRNDAPTVIYQVGDHDSAGLDAWNDIQRKLTEFVDELGGDVDDVIFERIAVTPAQITELGLITRPDKRNKTMEACEVDAIPTPYLRDLLGRKLQDWLDDDVLQETMDQQNRDRGLLYQIAEEYELVS